MLQQEWNNRVAPLPVIQKYTETILEVAEVESVEKVEIAKRVERAKRVEKIESINNFKIR
jgi:hypothetical protein